MKKSTQVPATLIAAIASGVVATGCSSTRNQCVDAAGRLLPDTECRYSGRTPGAHWIQTGGFGNSYGSSYGS